MRNLQTESGTCRSICLGGNARRSRCRTLSLACPGAPCIWFARHSAFGGNLLQFVHTSRLACFQSFPSGIKSFRFRQEKGHKPHPGSTSWASSRANLELTRTSLARNGAIQLGVSQPLFVYPVSRIWRNVPWNQHLRTAQSRGSNERVLEGLHRRPCMPRIRFRKPFVRSPFNESRKKWVLLTFAFCLRAPV